MINRHSYYLAIPSLLVIALTRSSEVHSTPTLITAYTPSLPRFKHSKVNRFSRTAGFAPVGVGFASSVIRFSTASAPGEAKGNPSKTEYELDLTHYSNTREFNLFLESIALECTGNRKNSGVDVISRASIAEALVRKLDAANAIGKVPFKADVATYNILMKVWARAAQTLAEGRGRGDINQVIHAMDDVPEELTFGGIYTAKDAANRASVILEELEQRYLNGESDLAPNTFGYNIVLDGLSKCQSRDSPQEAMKIFNKMKLWNIKGVLNAKRKKGEEEEGYANGDASKWQSIKPDAITYSVIMETLGQSKDQEVVAKVDELLEELESEYDKTNDHNLKPVTRVYNAAINAYLKHLGTPQKSRDTSNKGWIHAKKVHGILSSLNKKWEDTLDESYQPDITTYTMVIDAYGRCNDVAAVEKGEIIFEKVHKKWKETGDEKLKPSSRTFTVMVNAWAKTWDPRATSKVEELLKRMEDMYSDDVSQGKGDTSTVKPSIRTYTAAIGAWARSRDRTKSQHALKILKKVSDMYKETHDEEIKPTLYTYNSVIDTCARNGGSPDQSAQALKIAFAVNKAILAAKLEPNQITYSTLLKAVGKLLPQGDQRNEICKAVFEKCIAKGLVDSNVLKALEQSSDRDLFYELVGVAADKNGHVNFDEIPREWSKNVN
mmetsp:Transcript_12472/g.23405  ORF Transcript_12472/g.23405 Transcript_12472/m.23405 type:complete len:664 (-) Transcript_12472:1654-3645(-)